MRAELSFMCCLILTVAAAQGAVSIASDKNPVTGENSGNEMVDVSGSVTEIEHQAMSNNVTWEESETQNSSFAGMQIGKWTLIHCGSNNETWNCQLERTLVIAEIGFSDTVRFAVAGRKLRVGTDSNDDYKPVASTTDAPAVVGRYHLRIWVDCPKTCPENVSEKCPKGWMFLPSFWFGLVVGILFGIMCLVLLDSCISIVKKYKDEPKIT